MTTQNSNTTKEHADNAQEEVIDYRLYLALLNKYKWRILFLAGFVSVLATIYAMNLTPIYRATATLLIEEKENRGTSFEDIVGMSSSQTQFYATQIELLKSRKMAKTVIERMGLQDHPEFRVSTSQPTDSSASLLDNARNAIPFLPSQIDNGTPPTAEDIAEREMNTIISIFLSKLSISPVNKTQLVNITFESRNPKLAAQVANSLGDVYIDQYLSAKMATVHEAATWLTTRLSELRVRLDQSEQKLQNYREKENLIDVEGVLGLISVELQHASQQLVDAKNEKSALERDLDAVSYQSGGKIEIAELLTDIASNPAVQDAKENLFKVELKIAMLQQEFGPKHPKLATALAEAVLLRNIKADIVTQLLNDIAKRLETQSRVVMALEADLERIKTEYQALTAKDVQYRQLTREVETDRSVYDTFFTRAKEAEVTSDFNSAVARFTDRAVTPNAPFKPNKKLIVVLAFVASLGFGIVVAFVVEILNDTIKSPQDVENKLAQRMLGLLPLVATGKDANMLLHYFFEKEGKRFAEAVRTLRTGFVLSQLASNAQAVAVTSTIPGEGKSTTATNLAFSLGQIESTILVDADMRKPSICKRFDLPAYHPGLANIIAGTATLEECIHVDEQSGISVITAGQVPPNPLELLSSPKFDELIDTLKTQYQRIVIDTAPVQAVSDALVIAGHVDSMIYVVKSNETRIGAIENGLGRLMSSNAKIAGVVLNRVDSKKLTQNDYYHGYYTDYTYGERQESSATDKKSSRKNA